MKEITIYIYLILFCFLQASCDKYPYDEKIKKNQKHESHGKQKKVESIEKASHK